MARRNDHTREELFALTLDKVREFLETRPYHSLSLRKIATMIGYVPSTLINVFGSYNLLLLEVVGQTLDELYQEYEIIQKQELSPLDTLEAFSICYFEFATRQPHRWQLVFEHNMHGDELPKHAAERIFRVIQMLETQIRLIDPEQSEQKVVTISRIIWGSVHGITELSIGDQFYTNSELEGKALIHNFFDNYFSGLKASDLKQ
ncbi:MULTISPECIES: TetR/AcrR family transcriptional regulator [Vibrio]|uniref:TetR/AcrR family transcriptional regulator n=1 Tax=Vibrio algicola TaxID=2662262 RepID=A0A5Q0TDH2_9VIBR|nr:MULTISPECIES: TetR-like C-terminal domain-containing protein [Vibrio]MBD1575503.1 TetR/AcrR family transcriptional regulator [Vibrio sp. S11_S32]